MAKDANNSEHRTQAWAAIAAALVAIGAAGGGTLATVGASSHLWSDDDFLAGFAFACLLVALGVYALVGEFIGGLPLPATRHEREGRRRSQRRRPRLIMPKGRIPRRLGRPTAGRTPHGPARLELKPNQSAERQLAAAIRSGNVLRVRGDSHSQLGYQWRDEVEALVKVSAGELDASRFAHSGDIAHWLQRLDDLAQQVSAGTRTLAPSDRWDAYVETMMAFQQALDLRLTEGERLRSELFSKMYGIEMSTAKVVDWLQSVDDSLAPLPRYRDILRGAVSPEDQWATYEGMSEEEGKIVWRLDQRLQHLQPLLAVVAPYVEALRGK
jgi:hypothetical protein